MTRVAVWLKQLQDRIGTTRDAALIASRLRSRFTASHRVVPPKSVARLETQYLPAMPNVGKVERVVRELIAVLVDELGPEKAAHMLEDAAAQVRGAGHRPIQATTHNERRLHTGRKPAQVTQLRR